MELEYDSRSRISNQKASFGQSAFTDRIAYSADGHLVEVIGKSNWKYLYDENGNAVGIVDQGQKLSLGYDSGDRIVQVRPRASNSRTTLFVYACNREVST